MRHRNGNGRDPGQRFLDRTRICPTSSRLAQLVGDLLLLSRLLQKAYQARVVERRSIHGIDRRAKTQLRVVADVLTVIVCRQITGGCGVDRDGKIRMEVLGRDLCASQTDLLLHGKCSA